MSKKKQKKYNPTKTIGDFATLGIGLNVNYRLLGSTKGIPGASGSVDKLTTHMGTGYNLMGTGAMLGGSMGLLGSLKELERIGKKKRR